MSAIDSPVLAAPQSLPTTSPSTEPPVDFSVSPPLIPAEAEAVAEPTANYSDGEMSIDYPVDWEVEVDEAGDLSIANVPATPSELVETQLFRIASPPGPLVNANIDSFIEEGSAVSRYRSVTIDEQDALVMWLADRPDELGSAIATFIGYGDNTVMLFSRYSPENTTAENQILRLHNSFTSLMTADEQAEAEDAESDASEVLEPEALEIEFPETEVIEAVPIEVQPED